MPKQQEKNHIYPSVKKLIEIFREYDRAIEGWVQHFINEVDGENQKE